MEIAIASEDPIRLPTKIEDNPAEQQKRISDWTQILYKNNNSSVNEKEKEKETSFICFRSRRSLNNGPTPIVVR